MSLKRSASQVFRKTVPERERRKSPVSAFVNEFSWSKSRDELFRECRRKYYYDKYGSWGGWSTDANERVRALYIAKNLKSRHMWIGEVIHGVVEGILKEIKVGNEIKTGEILDRMTGKMRKDFRESRDGRYRNNPKKFLGLFEHEYNIPLDDEVWFKLHEKARGSILHLLESGILEEIKRLPPVDWLTLESLLDFHFEGNKIYLKMDFASRAPSGVLIIDWKTGEKDDVDSDVQLNCYGLYAVEAWNVEPSRITTVEYNLSLRKEHRKRLVPANIDWIKHYIRSSITSMKELLRKPEENLAREEDFPFTDNELTCKWCNYRKLCRKFLPV